MCGCEMKIVRRHILRGGGRVGEEGIVDRATESIGFFRGYGGWHREWLCRARGYPFVATSKRLGDVIESFGMRINF